MTALAPAGRTAIGARSSRLPALLVVLTAMTGVVDAASYLGMGHVLVANMTGNVVFLGFALAGAAGFSIASFAVSIAAFLVGAVVGGRLGVALSAHRRRWLTTAAAAQAGLAALAALGSAVGVCSPSGHTRFVVIALLGIGMGIQNATVRRLAVPDATTTVLTMTLTGLAADSSAAGGENPRLARRLVAVTAMLTGALIGASLMIHAGFTATLAVLAGGYTASTLGFAVLTGEDAAR